MSQFMRTSALWKYLFYYSLFITCEIARCSEDIWLRSVPNLTGRPVLQNSDEANSSSANRAESKLRPRQVFTNVFEVIAPLENQFFWNREQHIY